MWFLKQWDLSLESGLNLSSPPARTTTKASRRKIQRLNAEGTIFTKLIGAECPSHIAKSPYYSYTKERFPCQNYPLEHFSCTLILKKCPLPHLPTCSQAVYEEVFLQNDYNDICMIWLFWGLSECKMLENVPAYCTMLMLIFVIAISMLSLSLITVIRSHT